MPKHCLQSLSGPEKEVITKGVISLEESLESQNSQAQQAQTHHADETAES